MIAYTMFLAVLIYVVIGYTFHRVQNIKNFDECSPSEIRRMRSTMLNRMDLLLKLSWFNLPLLLLVINSERFGLNWQLVSLGAYGAGTMIVLWGCWGIIWEVVALEVNLLIRIKERQGRESALRRLRGENDQNPTP